MRLHVTVFLFSVLSAMPESTRADVVDSSAGGFTVRNGVTIAETPDRVYRSLVSSVGRWWNPAHTFSGDSRNLSIDDEAGGCFCEDLNGGSVQHLVVVMADEGKILRLSGALGPLQSMAVTGSMTWALSKTGSGTKVELTYTVGGYHTSGLQGLASPVDKVLLEQLVRLKRYIEKGKPEEDLKTGKQ